MKKNILTIGILLALNSTYSCKNQIKEKQDQNTNIQTIQIKEQPHNLENILVLNNGEQWLANPETTLGVKKMQEIMDAFTEKENTEAYKKLTENLKLEFKMIFEKCTMKGEAHEQLHHFLIPIKNLFETLPSSDLNQCKQSFKELNNHLSIYKIYFK